MPIPQTSPGQPRLLLRDDAYLALRAGIIDGTFAPGERLNDADLGRWLGVSRTPIREALGRLERAGLVQSKPGSYTRVSPLDVREARASQSVAAALHELAVREAVPNLSESDILAMREANRRFARALDAHDAEAALSADDDFHAVAVTASANPVAATVLEQVTPVLRRLERIRFASLDGRGSIALHEQIIALCEAGDAAAASAAARENWQTLLPLVDLADLVDDAADSQAG
jgi:DNA-binding GntR family transcriptional regulator